MPGLANEEKAGKVEVEKIEKAEEAEKAGKAKKTGEAGEAEKAGKAEEAAKAGKKVLVVGLGRSGMAAAEVMKEKGFAVEAYDGTESEEKKEWAAAHGLKVSFGAKPEGAESYDMMLLSPGVPTDLDYVREARDAGVEITGELEMAYRLGNGRFAAITGTNGKTTTTTLVGEIFSNAGRDARVVGNIGVPVMLKIKDSTEDTAFVTECSSFQLETIRDFRPAVSAVLNITPDHLNRHKTFENYIAAKARVFENQTEEQYFVYNAEDEICVKMAKNCKASLMPFSSSRELEVGAFVRDGIIVVKMPAGAENAGDAVKADNAANADSSAKPDNAENAGGAVSEDGVKCAGDAVNEDGAEVEICGADELQIAGVHNLENALAACAISVCFGIDAGTIASTLRTFAGVEHRMEKCGVKNGVTFVNDSKGTNPDAAIKAVSSYINVILIAGGYDKNAEYTEFVNSFEGHVKALILLGTTAEKIKSAALSAGFSAVDIVSDMREAVAKAYEIANQGDTVLLSPACASWDMYKNYELRGEDFKNCVKELK